MTTSHEPRKPAVSRRALLVVVNLLIVVVGLWACYSYSRTVLHDQEVSAQVSFATTVSSMRRVANGYLKSQQELCADWAAYLNAERPTMTEALDYLSKANSVKGVMAHILNYDTLAGFSSVPNRSGNNEVDYASQASDFPMLSKQMIDTGTGDSFWYATRTYTNPINAVQSVAFVQDVVLTGDGGAEEHYLLLRVVPLSSLQQQWAFPARYESAELSLINIEGDYVVRSASMTSVNFWDYLRFSNDMDYKQMEALRDETCTGKTTMLSLRNHEGVDSYYVCMPDDSKAQWYYIGYITRDAIMPEKMDYTLVYIVIAAFLCLLAFDGCCLVYVNKRLAASVEEARCASVAKTQFLSSMSHDIRTPMNAIVGLTAIATKRIDDREHVRECLKKITLASNHLLTLINDVLDISKVESGKLVLNPTVFSLADLTSNLVNIVRSQIREKGLEFDIDIHTIRHEYLFADELRLNQIFINLLTNAVKYTPAGGKIRLDLRESDIPDDPEAVLLTYVVQDTGIGMSEEFQATMYNTFVRAVDNRINTIQGSGLGLAITKQMVSLMNGDIACKSAPGEGTTFTVTVRLPIAEHLTDDLMLPPMHLLVVDNDPIFLETAEDLFSSMGVTADTAGDGHTAVRMVVDKHHAGQDYPVVIVDWKMPGMDGLATVRAIRAQVGNDVPILIVSAYDWSEIEEEARKAGANGFISKPFFRSSVYAQMTELLGLHEHEKAEEEDAAEDLAGLHLLVAEDNDLNWEIIEEMLSFYRITADRAVNGQICVSMLRDAAPFAYDAVLMDIQMPVMNGREAAQAIRAMSIDWVQKLPIIAMTADAFAEDVQACLKAGMNGHVAKPIDLKKLFAAMRKAGVTKREGGTTAL